jgi:hypothetical protein
MRVLKIIRIIGLTAGLFAGFSAVAVLAWFLGSAALAFDNGQWGDVPDNVRSWFKSVRSLHGVPCCDISDGHRTDYDIRADGYWIPIPEAPPSKDNWMLVPPEAVVYNAGNPIGEAVVWYVRQGNNSYYIRCFVPGGGV